tara:strand:+ start:401 stop:598 length:198 start_codon:yes stop_codon:yes gene_type:complete
VLLFFENLKLKIMVNAFGKYEVELIGELIIIRINKETVKCMDVTPSMAVEKYTEICNQIKYFTKS